MENKTGWRTWTLVVAGLVLAAGAAHAASQKPPCKVVDDGSGTVELPPDNCGYISPEDFHKIDLSGIGPNTQILLDPSHNFFICGREDCSTPGGTLGGEVELFGSRLTFRLTGTGALSGWSRTISVPANCETHTGPRQVGARVQSFPTAMYRLEGVLTGDPDFEYLHIRAGEAFGLHSPGKTTLTLQSDGTYLVDSTFSMTYTIDFRGTPDGALGGYEGASTGTVVMEAAASSDADTPPSPPDTDSN